MLEALDGVLLAVRDTGAARETYEALFDVTIAHREPSDVLGAEVTSLRCGTDLIRLAEPTGPGPVAEHLKRWGEGLIAAVFAARDVAAVAERLAGKGIGTTAEDGLMHLDPDATFGLRTIVTPYVERARHGTLSFIYEVTHLVRDWKKVSEFWTDAFGLDGAKFSPISSDTYGYEGMLTLFDPPDRLDRIEVVTPYGTDKAMGRFFSKRGEGPYMFFTECEDTAELRERLRAAGARFAPDSDAGGPQSLFVHPSSTHGVLIGVSPKNMAWTWSGRPELARA